MPDDQFFKDVAAEKARLEAEALNTALINGRKDAADLIASDEVQQFLANQALGKMVESEMAAAPSESPRVPVSSGRKRTRRSDPRKRQRQARKRQR